MVMRPWREAWQDALYGPQGFYRTGSGPAGHFTTSAHGDFGGQLAAVVARLADDAGVCRVLDFGCGRGELLTHLAHARPDLELIGVDVVERPPGLAADVQWARSVGGGAVPDSVADLCAPGAVVLAHEWLDVVPCTIAEIADDGTARQVLVNTTGTENLGDALTDEEQAWARTWWPTHTPGDRIEVGLTRDRAWRNLVSCNPSGVTVAVDYAHTKATRPRTGTLAAYVRGQVTAPAPDGRRDLTAHVAIDSLGADEVLTQRHAFDRWGPPAPRPDHDLARTDPRAYLQALSSHSARTALTSAHGLGGFAWAISGHTRTHD